MPSKTRLIKYLVSLGFTEITSEYQCSITAKKKRGYIKIEWVNCKGWVISSVSNISYVDIDCITKCIGE